MYNNNKPFCVYLHTSPSNKYYVGITCNKPTWRWGRNGVKYKNNEHFWNAIQKYGWENFKHEIIAGNLNENEAKKLEIELIERFQSNNPQYGYNHTKGGDGIYGYKKPEEQIKRGWKHTEETKRKMSEIAKERYVIKENNGMYGKHHKAETIELMRNKTFSEETRQKISEKAKLRVGELNSHYGKKHSEETKKLISNINKGRKGRTKIILQYSLEEEFLNEYNSLKEASDKLRINMGHISECCNGKRPQAGGYKWKYKEDIIWEQETKTNR